MKPRLLDLFCGAGGASVGYYRAGFEVVGIDIVKQPHYPFEFYQADALEFPLEGFDLIHASPPCKVFTRMKHLRESQGTNATATNLIPQIRDRLLPYAHIIENVSGAPLNSPLILCGSSFGLRVRRHRLFESSMTLAGLPCIHSQQGRPVGVWNWGRWGHEIPGGGKSAESLADALDAMGIDWMMNRLEVSESIPPAYTEFLGRQVLDATGG